MARRKTPLRGVYDIIVRKKDSLVGHLRKVLIWRAISVVITLVITWMWAGSLFAATGLTIALQIVLLVAHWIFEDAWLKITVNKILAPKKTPFEKTASGRDEEDTDVNDHLRWRP